MLNSPVDEIKSRLDIVELIGSYLKLQKAGANYRGLCPFHTEKKPSFFVSPSRQIWHCFGSCSLGGDIFKFIMKIEGVEFREALRILAQKAGVELRRQTAEDKKLQTEKERLYEVCELAARFFEKQLQESKIGQEVQNYLFSRGLTQESIRKWRLGYAPDSWCSLTDFLLARGYREEEIKKAGLGLFSEKNSFYDRFRARIIFPIFDLNSQVVGFGGRILKSKEDQEVAKYVNTPQTALYDKSRILYGLDKAKLAIRKKDSCLLVEGYMDLIMVFQAGFENVVATSGTALTPFQLRILKRYSDNLFIAFDMDAAGEAATKRGIDLAQLQGFNIKVITLPQGLDPADLILQSKEKWQESFAQARSIMDFYFESVFEKFDRETPEGKKEISKILLPVIKKIPNKIIQAHWANQLAKKLKVREQDIAEELKKIRLSENSSYFESGEDQKEVKKSAAKPRKELLEERLAVLVLKLPRAAEIIKKEDLEIVSEPIRAILTGLKAKTGAEKETDTELFNYLALKSEIEQVPEKDIEPEVQYCLKEISMIENKKGLNQISQEIRSAEEEKEWGRVEELKEEFNRLTKQQCQS